jgi:Tol biopolymer transport system component
MISSDGRFVVFRNLAGSSSQGFSGENLFVRDLSLPTTRALTTKGVSFSTMSSDGRFVMYESATNVLYVWDLMAGAAIYTNPTPGIPGGAISPRGERLVYWAGSGFSSLFAADLALNTNWLILSGVSPGPHPTLRFDSTGRKLAYTAMLNGTTQVYLYDFQTGSNFIASGSYDSSGPGDNNSDTLELSADGRFIAYRSSATNLVPADTNGVPDIFLYDTVSGVNSLLSMIPSGMYPNNRSLLPAFSGDGRIASFQSWASDLAPLNFNQGSDVFVYSLFYADLQPDSLSGNGVLVSWPNWPGRSYRVEFNDAAPGPTWQEFSGTPVYTLNKAYLLDADPKPQRFYRIRSF